MLDVVQTIDSINSLSQLDRVMKEVLSPFGVTYFGGHRIFDPGHLARPGVLFGNIQPEWERHYTQAGHVSADPAVRMLFETSRPYTWTEARKRFQSKQAETVMEECREINGTLEGLVIPIRDVDGSILTALFSGPELDLGPLTGPALHLLGLYYMLRGRELLSERQKLDGPSRLTPRQTECLKWVSQGKTDDEIGVILGISSRTVHNHVEGAKRALGASKRSQAALLAFRHGWIA